MDDLFKQKLLSLRTPVKATSFSVALLGDGSWLKRGIQKITPRPVTPPEVFTEKTQVLESFERFAQEKVEASGTQAITFPGGEVSVKAEPGWEGLSHFKDAQTLKASLKLEPALKNVVLTQKIPGEVKVLFVSEKFRNWNEVEAELKGGFLDELIVGFPLKTAELFHRMIGAMKLEGKEVIIYPVEGVDEQDFSHEVMEIASLFRPEVIVTLGAKATSKILKSNDRLSMVHGQFFTRKLGNEGAIQVVPLFHPSIIETNQNMKKTAWADMQKIMKHLKKLP